MEQTRANKLKLKFPTDRLGSQEKNSSNPSWRYWGVSLFFKEVILSKISSTKVIEMFMSEG